MTENEAINVLKKPTKHIKTNILDGEESICFTSDMVRAFEIAIQALKDIQKYKTLGDYETLQRLADSSFDVDKAITNQTVSVWVQERVDEISVKNEREFVFNNINNAIQFMNGISTIDYNGKEVSKSEQDEIESVQMDTYFDPNKLVSIKDQNSQKKSAASYIGEMIYRIDIDPYMTNDGENYQIKEFPITSIEQYRSDNLVLKSGEEDVCLLENINTEKPFLDCYICFSSKEKANEYIESLQKEDKDIER